MIDHNAQGWRLNTWKEVKEVIVEAMQKGNMFISEADVNNYYFSDTDRLAQAQTETAISYMEQQIFDGLRVYYSKVDPTKTEEDWYTQEKEEQVYIIAWSMYAMEIRQRMGFW